MELAANGDAISLVDYRPGSIFTIAVLSGRSLRN
jgi:hypothetical protein